MTTNRDPDVTIAAWLDDGPDVLPPITRQVLVSSIHLTPQRRDWLGWFPWRIPIMNGNAPRLAVAAVIGLLVLVGGGIYLSNNGSGGVGGQLPAATPTPAPTTAPTGADAPPAIKDGPLAPGKYVSTGGPVLADVPMRFTFDVPDGWAGVLGAVWLTGKEADPPDGASLGFGPGGSLHSQPCGAPPPPDIEVGPTVDDFANALADHPLLDVTDPVDVTLDGYAGKYVDLQIPSDISACPTSYFPWEPGIYAQGPGQRWHVWILDIDGVRVVVMTTDYAGTSAEDRAELEAMVDSLQIETVVAPATSPSASP